ncbi:MAG: nucleotidyltransferase domain-containing protein [Pseudomonadota bacterium]|nr:nucleotidyltransferase domain-containing protein [Pseudomonadota bacterium]
MRLSSEDTNAIKETFLQVFDKGELYLFGSRVDDSRKGGDIDLYVVADDKVQLGEKRIEFLARVKQRIGKQRIDLVVDRGTRRPIDEIAKAEGLLLCQQH